MTDMGDRYAVGALSPDNLITPGCWVVSFTSSNLPIDNEYEMYHGALRDGPGGYFLMYRGSSLYGVGVNGKVNEYNPDIPMYCRKGQEISLHWSIATGTAPKVWLYFRTPTT